YYEALGAAVDVPLPAVNKAELLVKMSLEGSAAFNDMSFEERDKFAGAAQLGLDDLEHDLREYGWQDRPLNKDQVEVALRRVNEKSKVRKIGSLLSRTFVQHARSHEQDDTYYE